MENTWRFKSQEGRKCSQILQNTAFSCVSGIVEQLINMLNQIGHLEHHTSQDCVVSRKTLTKLKQGICVGLQIKELLRDFNFKTTDELELPALIAFYWVCQNYLSNNTAVEYKDGINNLLECYSAVGCGMSLKVLFLDSHLDFFQRTLEQYQMNKASDFTRALVLWRNGTKVSGMTACQLTAAGHYTAINQLSSIFTNPNRSVSNSVIL